MSAEAAEWLARIRGLGLTRPVGILNVCGGHERTLSTAGLRQVLPGQLRLIPGPGCPVCVCPEADVRHAMALAGARDLTLCTFGDMLRVPVVAPRGEPRSLEQVRAAGGDVRPVASPLEAVRLARSLPRRRVVLFVAGFETTMAPLAAVVAQGLPDNLLLLTAGRRTWPAVAMLLATTEPGFDALVAPGHVATVMGSTEWRFVVQRHRMPVAVAGFTPASLLAAIYSVCRQRLEGRPFLDNCYPEAVRVAGNPGARRLLDRVFRVESAHWRGIGEIAGSGLVLRRRWARHDARLQLPHPDTESGRESDMPPACECARVVLGRLYPSDCPLYGRACTPRAPVGPCMVSDEGACRIWWSTRTAPGRISEGSVPG